jgi:hypothetical protein
MNQISFFIRPEIVFDVLQELFDSELIHITFKINPDKAKKLLLQEAENGENIYYSYLNQDAEEVIITETISCSTCKDIAEFYSKSAFEMITIQGCKQEADSYELSSMRILHTSPTYRAAFDLILKRIKSVSHNKVIKNAPKIYLDDCLVNKKLLRSIGDHEVMYHVTNRI